MNFDELIYPRVHQDILRDVADPWNYASTEGLIPLLEFSDALGVIRQSLDQTLEKRYKRLEKAQEHEGAYDDLLYDYYSADSLLYSSVLIHVLGVFEASMLALCERRQGTQPLSVKDIAGTGIGKYKTYLAKVLRVPFDFGASKEWQQIQDYWLVRNCLAHKAGRIPAADGDSRLPAIVREHPHLTEQSGALIITEAFCKEVIATCIDFWASFVRAEAKQADAEKEKRAMTKTMSSRQRMLAALGCEKPDYVPLAFMIFGALNTRLNRPRRGGDPTEVIAAQIGLGLDAVVDLTFVAAEVDEVGHSDAPGLPVRFGEGVTTRQWAEMPEKGRYPTLHKEYLTPAGTLSVAVEQTADWPYGDAARGDFRVPLMDDYLAPRCTKRLVENREDLAALRHLLVRPTEADLNTCHKAWAQGKELAREHDLLLAGGWGVGADALAWFCGLQQAVMLAIDEPDLLEELLGIIDAWNRPRMQALLDFGVDLFIRRAWYEGTDFWSPALCQRFLLPVVREEVRLAHEAGAKYGYILTSGSMPLHETLIELGVDVLIGPDPIQGKGTDLRRMGRQLRGKMCTWGGVNGFLTVEGGTKADIDAAVREAMAALGPAGFILSPVDNVRDPSDATWENVLALIESWKKYRG